MVSKNTKNTETSEREQNAAAREGEILSRAELVSRSLKDVSRQLRRSSSGWGLLFQGHAGRRRVSFGGWIILAFLALVVIPVAVSGLYVAFWMSDQYASEAKFAVRGGDRGTADMLSGLTGGVRVQDSLIVANYIEDGGIIGELSKSLDLRAIYSRPGVDFLSGFNPANPVERLQKFWTRHVDVKFEAISGIVTVVVRAFTPEDALALARSVIAASEKLVNEMSERSRRDALRQAQQEVVLAERSLQEKMKAMRELRDREGILDPTKASDALTKVVADLRLQLARLQGEYAAQRATVSDGTPQLRLLDSRIRATRQQIAEIEAHMTATGAGTAAAVIAGQNPALAESMSRFDRLRLEQDFAQKYYVEAAATLERARITAESQQIYLATFVQPVLAQEALYPKRWWIMAAMIAICLALWAAGVGAAVLLRNYAF